MSRKLFVIPAVLSALIGAPAGWVSQAQAQIQPYLGQMMLVGNGYCPRGWASASGQLLAIAQNQALFAIMGTQFGGNGTNNFQLPNLNARTPIGSGSGSGLPPYAIGETGGALSFTLNVLQLPVHTHFVRATNVLADRSGPLNKYLGLSLDKQYHTGPQNVNMAADMLTSSGGNQPVSHTGPFLTMKWCIAVQGIFPSRD